jgi:hypothetical protein
MSNKKNLLNESQIRQFMKLASLTPLTPGFVEGLKAPTALEEEELDEVRTPRGGSATGERGRMSHGGTNALEEEYDDRDELENADDLDVEADDLEDDAAEDLGDLDVGDEEVELDVEVSEGPTEEEVLAALEVIARAAGVEGLEMDVESTGEPSEEEVVDVEEPVLDVEEPVLDEPLDVEVEDEMELQETGAAKNKSAGTTDELVEQITKRVAARILKSALTKK